MPPLPLMRLTTVVHHPVRGGAGMNWPELLAFLITAAVSITPGASIGYHLGAAVEQRRHTRDQAVRDIQAKRTGPSPTASTGRTYDR